MATNEKLDEENLLILKIIQIAPLLPIAIYILIVAILYTKVGAPMFDRSSAITIATGILAIIGVITLVIAYYLPQWMINSYRKKSKSPPSLVTIGIIRSGCFVFVSICGLIIAILSTWIITAILFVAICGAIVITFPTMTRLNKMLELGKISA